MEVSELLSDFQRLLSDAQAAGADGDAFLRVMAPDAAEQFRLCAIPHQYDAEILHLLVPSLDAGAARERCLEFAALSAVTLVGEGWSVHEKWRRGIFRAWLAADRRAEFEAASRRLAEWFGSRIDLAEGDARETLIRRRMYHVLGVDRAAGFKVFQDLCRDARAQLRYTECAALIRLVHDYDIVLTADELAIVAYHEGKLASDLRDWPTAERLLAPIAEASAIAAVLRTKAHLRLGFVLAQQGKLKDAMAVFERARALAQSDPAAAGVMPRVLHELGLAHRDLGEDEPAEALLLESSRLALASEFWSAYAVTCNSLGSLYLRQRRPTQAIEVFETALTRLAVTTDALRVSQVYNNLGLATSDLADWPKSESWFLKSLEIKRRAGDLLGQALALNNLVRVRLSQRRFDDAVVAGTEALRHFQAVGDARGAGVAAQNLGKAMTRLGKPDEARERFAEAIAFFGKANDASGQASAQADRDNLADKAGLPWWAWTVIVLVVLLVLFVVAVIWSDW